MGQPSQLLFQAVLNSSPKAYSMADTQRVHEVDIQVDEEFETLIDKEFLKAAAQETLRQQAIAAAALTIVVTGDAEVQALNAQYRNIDAPTDVLSFSNWAGSSTSDAELILPAELAMADHEYLGDIIIAYPYAAQQAERYQNSISAELRLLVVHGTLHLLGYDHATLNEQKAMWNIQDAVLKALGDSGTPQRSFDA